MSVERTRDADTGEFWAPQWPCRLLRRALAPCGHAYFSLPLSRRFGKHFPNPLRFLACILPRVNHAPCEDICEDFGFVRVQGEVMVFPRHTPEMSCPSDGAAAEPAKTNRFMHE